MDNSIRLCGVSFAYDEDKPEEKALDNVDLTIRSGEFLGIIGHNGSGKSTLAKMLNGLMLPSSGDVYVYGMNTRDDERIIDIRRAVGMVFQNPDNQMVATIVEEDVAFGAENLGMSREEIRAAIEQALKSVGMYEFRDKKPHQLSGGQKQRVAIAGILAMKPACIIFDESTAMLDPKGRADVLRQMHRLNDEEQVTIVLITHYMEELIDADRIVLMSDGRIVGEGTPGEIFADTEKLNSLRLNVPEIVQIANELRRDGVDIPMGILRTEEMVEALCRLK